MDNKLKLLSVCLFAFLSFNVNAYDVRIEGQAGGAQGDVESNFAGLSFDESSETGISVGGAAWLDGWLMPVFSVGVQYNRIMGNDLEDDSVSAAINFDTDLFMVNAVFRDNVGGFGGKFHPYAGGGIGFARVDTEVDILGITVDEGDDIGFAGQFMAGFDYDILEHIYFGVNVAYLFNDAEPETTVPLDVDFETWRFMAVLGMKF